MVDITLNSEKLMDFSECHGDTLKLNRVATIKKVCKTHFNESITTIDPDTNIENLNKCLNEENFC